MTENAGEGDARPLRDVSTVHLGQFDRETANDIAAALEEAGIVWWYKEPGWLSSIWEHGVRLFVDRARLDEAKALLETVRARRGSEPGTGEPSGGA